MTQTEKSTLSFTPREIVNELDRFIIGQNDAKRAVAVALRNRWRRQQLSDALREEVLPKNMLMIGPTGVGKTEIARRLAKLAGAPFIKVEATKFTEIGYVGRDVESIIRDLVELAISQVRQQKLKSVRAHAELKAEERLLRSDSLAGKDAQQATLQMLRKKFRSGEIDDKEIQIELAEVKSNNNLPMMEVPGMPGASIGAFNLGDILGKGFNQTPKKMRTTTVAKAYEALINEESESLINDEDIQSTALDLVQNQGIVFLDEIDKICASNERRGGDVSREGVQRDLLPLIEGTTVATKYGAIKTDHILFIASGAFHVAKPSDLLPELQGRLPIRVELKALSEDDFKRILTEPENSLIRQYSALMATEGLTLDFDESAIEALAQLAAQTNSTIENIGARRLHTLLERVLDELSFKASDMSGEAVTITAQLVRERVESITQSADLSKYIL